jgi:lysozyme family protein
MGFKECLNEVLKYEGTYSNHENDRGKETFRGISRKWHPRWDGWEIIDMVKETVDGIKVLKSGDITPALGEAYNNKLNQFVALFYKEEFWDRIKGDVLAEIDQTIACEVFDMAVSMGVRAAIKNLQKAINATYQNYIDARVEITEDGIFGKVTEKHLKELKEHELITELIEYFRKYRALRYAEIVRHNPNQAVFILGWLKRALKVS